MATIIILTVISIAVGGVVTFLLTRWYYERASGELKREASELRDYTVTLINYFDDARMIDVERDAPANLFGSESSSKQLRTQPASATA